MVSIAAGNTAAMVLSAKGIALRGERARAHSGSTIASKSETDARIWRIDRRLERFERARACVPTRRANKEEVSKRR
jgi:hypothetical protein